MFQTIVAEMTTKDKSYGDYFPADSVAFFIAFLPKRLAISTLCLLNVPLFGSGTLMLILKPSSSLNALVLLIKEQ